MAATDATKFLNKTEYERSLGRISEEFDKVAYLGERISGTPVAPKKLSVSPRQSIIVGRCIPLHPRKGKKYYFKDGIIKVKTDSLVGSKREIDYYFYYKDTGRIEYFATYESQSGYPAGWSVTQRKPVLVEITEESPKGKATFDLATMTKVREVTIDNSITESPFFEIINGCVVVTEIPHPRLFNDSLHPTGTTQGNLYRKGSVKTLYFKSGKVVAYAIGNKSPSHSRRKNTAIHPLPLNLKRRNWARTKDDWNKFGVDGAGYYSARGSFRGNIRVFSRRRGRIGRTPFNVIGRPVDAHRVALFPDKE